MAIVISGVNNNDKITASDGTIDLLSGVNYVGVLTAPNITASNSLTAGHLNIGSNIQLGNAGVATATTFVGNLTGNVNNTGNLLLQISGSEKFRVGGSGQLGIGGANYGTSGQVLSSGGSGSAATWQTIDLSNLNASNLTSGTVPNARISAGSVTQHVTAFDDNNIVNDISALALKVNALQNATRYNTNSMSVETFQDSNGIASLTTVQRNADGEYLSSIVTTTTNVTEGFKGGQSNNTGAEASFSNSGAQSYTGYDGVNRVAGQLGNPASYNSFNLGHIFDAGQNFEVVLTMRGNWQGIFYLYGALGSTLSSVGTYNGDVPKAEIADSTPTNMSSLISGGYYTGQYHAPVAGQGSATVTAFYRFHRENNTVKVQYTSQSSDVAFGATQLAALRASTDYVSNMGSPATRSEKMMVGIGEAGTSSYIKVEVANYFADTVNATGTAISNAITASSSITKMGVVITYINASGTTTLNTDLKVYLSADNGSNFTQVTLVAQPDFATGVKMAIANDVTVTAGTQLKYKVEFANQASGSKETRVTGVSVQY